MTRCLWRLQKLRDLRRYTAFWALEAQRRLRRADVRRRLLAGRVEEAARTANPKREVGQLCNRAANPRNPLHSDRVEDGRKIVIIRQMLNGLLSEI